jgi:hypothetical protein
MMAAGLAPEHLAAIDVIRDRRLGRQRTSFVDRRIDILPAPIDRPVHQRRHDRHVGEMTAHVPGVAAARSDRRAIGCIGFVIAAGGHFAACRHVQEIAREIIPPWAGLPKGGQRAHHKTRVLIAHRVVIEAERSEKARRPGFKDDVGAGRQSCKERASVRGLDIEGDAALGGVVVPE